MVHSGFPTVVLWSDQSSTKPKMRGRADRLAIAWDFSSSRYSAISRQSAEVGITKRDSKSVAYENRTKSAKCGGLETNGPREKISGLGGLTAVRRFRAKARRYWRFQRGKTRRRKLVSEGLAERVGFEPTVRLPVRRISSAVQSTTLPPLRSFKH